MKRVLKVMAEESVGDKFEEFLQDKKVKGCCDKTLHSYRSHINAIKLDMDTDINSINWNKIILDIRSKEISETSKNTYLRTLKVFMKWLGETDLPVIKKLETVKELYTDEELRKLIAKPKNNCSFSEYRTWCIILLVLDTGLRAKSIRNILIKDLDLDNNIVNIRHTKTRKVQILPFSNTTRNALKRLLDAYKRAGTYSADNYLFSSVYSFKFTENGLAEAIIQYNHHRGVEKTSIHLLRHNFSRAWIINGGDAFSLQSMLGHSDLTMTKHYTQLYSQDLVSKYHSPVEALTRKQIKLT